MQGGTNHLVHSEQISFNLKGEEANLMHPTQLCKMPISSLRGM